MWLFNSGCPCGLPQKVFYVKDATIQDVDFNAPVIRAVKNCVAQMSDTGVVTMLGYSVAAGCTEPNFIIRPNYTRGAVNFRDDQIRRPPFYQFDLNFAKTTRLAGDARLQLRFELFNVLNQVIYDERQYENNPTNPLFGSIDRTVVRQSNFPRYGQIGIKLLFAAEGVAGPRFSEYVRSVSVETERRVAEGEREHFIYYALQSTRFTDRPRIEPAVSAQRFIESLSPPDRAHFLEDRDFVPSRGWPAAERARIRDAVAALAGLDMITSESDIRLLYFKQVF